MTEPPWPDAHYPGGGIYAHPGLAADCPDVQCVQQREARADLSGRLAAMLRDHGMVHLGDDAPADEYECCAAALLPVIEAEIRSRPKPDGSFADVQGRCPACGRTGLFLGEGGYVTCPHFDCPEPDAASTLLERDVRAEQAASPEPTPGGLTVGE